MTQTENLLHQLSFYGNLISSNLERLLYHLSGGDGAAISKLMEDLENEKRYQVSGAVKEKMSDFFGGFADEGGDKKSYRRNV